MHIHIFTYKYVYDIYICTHRCCMDLNPKLLKTKPPRNLKPQTPTLKPSRVLYMRPRKRAGRSVADGLPGGPGD